MMPLCFAEIGKPQIIKRVGGNPETRQHLEDIGFHVGGEICIVCAHGNNLIIKVKDCRIAVSSELAQKIMV